MKLKILRLDELKWLTKPSSVQFIKSSTYKSKHYRPTNQQIANQGKESNIISKDTKLQQHNMTFSALDKTVNEHK